ncbi:101_t:CDS:1, partial [Racocetra fulgida]
GRDIYYYLEFPENAKKEEKEVFENFVLQYLEFLLLCKKKYDSWLDLDNKKTLTCEELEKLDELSKKREEYQKLNSDYERMQNKFEEKGFFHFSLKEVSKENQTEADEENKSQKSQQLIKQNEHLELSLNSLWGHLDKFPKLEGLQTLKSGEERIEEIAKKHQALAQSFKEKKKNNKYREITPEEQALAP